MDNSYFTENNIRVEFNFSFPTNKVFSDDPKLEFDPKDLTAIKKNDSGETDVTKDIAVQITYNDNIVSIYDKTKKGLYVFNYLFDGKVIGKFSFSIVSRKFTPTPTPTAEPTPTVTDNQKNIALSKGLVAYYEFEGNANDSSGNGNDGIEYGGVSYVDGVIGKAGNFDGLDDYIKIPDDNSLTPKTYTISTFYKSSSTDYLGEICSKGIDKHYYEIQFNSSVENYEMEFWYEDSSDSDYYILTSNGFDTEWHMATMIFDEATLTLKAYIDSILVEKKVFSSKPYNNNYDLWIGHGDNGYFNGKIDDFRIYNRALNDSEIKKLFSSSQIKFKN